MRAGPRRWTLRRRLIVGQVLLLAGVCLVISLATVLLARESLLHQLDVQLASASVRARDYAERHGETPPGQAFGTINILLDGREVLDARRLDPETSISQRLTPEVRDALLTTVPDDESRSVDLPGLGGHRVIATVNDGLVVITAIPSEATNATTTTIALIVGGVSLIGLVIAVAAGAMITRRTLRPLDRMAATAARVAELPMHQGEVALAERVPEADTDARTEVGQVGAALNHLLGRVADALRIRHASETRVRRFVADASHELRTPLASIQGYAELAGRDTDMSPELTHAIGRITAESRRMATLVDDLLLLARLDSGRPLERVPVDMSRLLVDAVSDARIAGDGWHWRVEQPAEPVMITGDPQRLHQVLANLLSNARTHTPAGSTVTARLHPSPPGGPATVWVTVSDDGPGIPESVLPTVFERFARGDTSRSRAAGSTGLGLAIVAAVVRAHGGTITVRTEPGATTFTVALPAG